jgi:hypothetical protein
MSKSKIIKPGTIVFDLQYKTYVIFKGDSVDYPDRVFVFNPARDQTYLTAVRPLNRKERGES